MPLLEAGANIIGACCGSTPDHIRAFRRRWTQYLDGATGASAHENQDCATSTRPRSTKLPQHTDDKSGIGVHYVDAYLKPMNAKLEDGTPVKCKRRGLKIVAVGRHAEGRRADAAARRRAPTRS